MNTTVIEAQARYLIEDRIHPTHRQHEPTGRTPSGPEGPQAELAVTLSSRPRGKPIAARLRSASCCLGGSRQIGVRWKFWNERDGVGPR